VTLNPVDDAYVASDNAAFNFGQVTTLQTDSSPIKEAYLKFNLQSLGGLSIPLATLRMFVADGSGHLQNIKQVADNSWTEDTLTFNNRPPKGATITSFTQSSGGVWVELNITSYVAANAGSFMSLAIDSNGTNPFAFNSAEAASNRVELVIYHGAIPTPTPTSTPAPTPTPTPTPAPGTPTPTPTATPTPAPGTPTPTPGATPDPNGYKGPSFSGASAPTGEKPQSKLWFNDGIWWGSLLSTAAQEFHIHRLDWATQTWTDTGILVDTRNGADADVLWDGTKLYIASVVPFSTSSGDRAELRRFSYNAATDTYTLDSGFPATIVSGISMETIVLAKDSTNTLWVTYTNMNAVWVVHTTTDDSTWGTPFTMPVPNVANLTADDISAIVAFDSKIGVMWGNQNTYEYYFATHADGEADMTWQYSVALAIPEGSDDHINLKALSGDPAGRVFAAVKTSLNSSNDPLIMLLVLEPDGTWTNHTFSRVSDDQTRAIVQIDQQNRTLYMFAAAPCCSGGAVYYKQTSLDAISFPTGSGATFMQSAGDNCINNPSSTKQNHTNATDLVAFAGANCTSSYFHNKIDLP
jgi:cell division septation protein DedD